MVIGAEESADFLSKIALLTKRGASGGMAGRDRVPIGDAEGVASSFNVGNMMEEYLSRVDLLFSDLLSEVTTVAGLRIWASGVAVSFSVCWPKAKATSITVGRLPAAGTRG